MAEGPLSGVKVIEYCNFVAGPFCAKQFSDLGAEVIKIEMPKGDEARHRGPYWKDIPNPEYSGLFLYCNTNKLGVTLDLEKAEARSIFKKLIAEADILIEDTTPGEMNRLGLDYSVLKEINPGLVMASITPFGQTGPYATYKSYYLNTFHGGGVGYLLPANSPTADREPIKAGGYLGECDIGMCSAIGIMTAYYWKQYGGGTGQYLDLSKQEALMTIERQNLLFFYEWGTSPTRCDCNYHTIREAAVRCSDGNYVKIVIHPDRQWQGLCRALGSPEWTRQDIFADHDTRAEYFAEMNAYLAKEGEKYTANELFSLIQAEGTACAPICSAEWVYDSPQMEARKFFTEIPHPLVGERKYPGLPYQLTNTTPANNFGAPLLGQHNEEIYCNRLGYSKQDMVRLKEAGVI